VVEVGAIVEVVAGIADDTNEVLEVIGVVDVNGVVDAKGVVELNGVVDDNGSPEETAFLSVWWCGCKILLIVCFMMMRVNKY